jgi:hypothetical protein
MSALCQPCRHYNTVAAAEFLNEVANDVFDAAESNQDVLDGLQKKVRRIEDGVKRASVAVRNVIPKEDMESLDPFYA